MVIPYGFWRILLALAGVAALPGHASASETVVDEVIALAKQHALNGDRPDWAAVEREAEALLVASPGEQGETAAIRYVLKALADGHSFYRPAGGSTSPGGSKRGDASASVPRPIAEADAELPGRLIINRWSGDNAATAGAMQAVRSVLNDVLANSRCGLVIDVSTNSGGNMWPMMGGIAPMYDDGTLLTFESREGRRNLVNVHEGWLRMNDNVYPRASLPGAVRKPQRIAIVIGPRTASSGEILALGFKGQDNVRFFGEPTAGATTSNRTMPLSTGGLLAITTSRLLDRDGEVQRGPVLPDVAAEAPLPLAAAWVEEACD